MNTLRPLLGLYQSGVKWIQHCEYECDDNGLIIGACLVGAIYLVKSPPSHVSDDHFRDRLFYEMHKRIDTTFVWQYNDKPDRSYADVISMLSREDVEDEP